jgi:hypothetical protein
MLAMGVFGEDGSQTLLPTLLSSPTVLTALLCFNCLLTIVACIFPLLFALKWDDDSIMPWNNVFIPVWIVASVVIIAMFVLVAAPWFVRLLIWSRVIAFFAFFVCLNLSLNVVEAKTVDPSLHWSGWEVFAPLFVFEALSLLTNALFMGLLLTAYRAECEQGLRRSNIGLGYVGWLLRRLLTPLFRLAIWCTLAGAIDDGAGLQRPLLPLGFLVGWLILTAMCDSFVLAKNTPADESGVPPSPVLSAFQRGCSLALCGVLLMVWAGLYLTYMNALLATSIVLREPSELPWTAVVSFTTVWIVSLVLIIACCCICVCGSCAVCSQSALADEADDAHGGASAGDNLTTPRDDNDAVEGGGAASAHQDGTKGFVSAKGSSDDSEGASAEPETPAAAQKQTPKKKAAAEESIDSIEDVD